MFEELIRTAIVPLIGRLAAPPSPSGSVRDALEGFAKTFIQEVATTRRGDIIRLIVAEGPRFPAIADFYYREVVSRGLAGDARADRARHRAWRDPASGARALSADRGGAGDRRGDLEEPVRTAFAAGCRSRCFASISI